MPEKFCPKPHMAVQPNEDEFKCPHCGATEEFFYVDATMEDILNGVCKKIHPKDNLICDFCGFKLTGSGFAKHVTQLRERVPCPHCAGTGFVPKNR